MYMCKVYVREHVCVCVYVMCADVYRAQKRELKHQK